MKWNLQNRMRQDGMEGDGLSWDGMEKHRKRSDDLELNEMK